VVELVIDPGYREVILEQIVLSGQWGVYWSLGLVGVALVLVGLAYLCFRSYSGDIQVLGGFLCVVAACVLLGAYGNYEMNRKKQENPEYYLEYAIQKTENRFFYND